MGNMTGRIVRWIILLAVGFGIGSAIGYFQAKIEGGEGYKSDYEKTAEVLKRPEDVPKKIGGAFNLVDHNGENVTQDTYGDQFRLLFFGFSFCPAVCPTELQKVAAIMDELGEAAEKITPIFISVDPERDTPDVLKSYVAQFHPKMVGLTGSQEQIDTVKNAFRVYANKVENDMMEGYMMDHSSFLYLTGPDGLVEALYPSKDTFEEIAADIRKKLK